MFIKHAKDYRNADVPASLYEKMGKFIEETEETTKGGNFVALPSASRTDQMNHRGIVRQAWRSLAPAV